MNTLLETAAGAPVGVRSLRIVSADLDDPRWLRFVSSQPEAGPFHEPAWAGLLADCYGFRAFSLLALNDSGEVRAGLPVVEVGKRWISLPFTDACAPLRADDVGERELVGLLDEARRDASVARLEVRAGLEGVFAHRTCTASVHSLPLEADSDAVYARFGRSQVQRQIRKGEQAGVQVRHGLSADDLVETFYGLHLRTRQRLGVPVQPRRFFRLLWERMLEPGRGFVLLADADGRTVAGAVFLVGNGRLTYKFGASTPESWKLFPNNLLMWSAIRWGCENGCHSFDFGRTELENEGLRRFKGGWGSTEEPLVYTTIAARPPRPASGRLSRSLRPVLQRSPTWLVRALGETLYRYAA